jgi:hypothetical protein
MQNVNCKLLLIRADQHNTTCYKWYQSLDHCNILFTSLWKNNNFVTESSHFVACSSNNYIRMMVLTQHCPVRSWSPYCTVYSTTESWRCVLLIGTRVHGSQLLCWGWFNYEMLLLVTNKILYFTGFSSALCWNSSGIARYTLFLCKSSK